MSGASGKVAGQGAGDRIRQPMSVEQLLIWAYADQMVDRAQRDIDISRPSPPRVAASQLWSEGSAVSASAVSGFGAADDAWSIHAQVMQLDKVTIDCGRDLAAARFHGRSEYRGHEPPLDVAAKGDDMRGPATGRPWPTDGLLNLDVRTLVQIHARRATRPELPARIEVRFKPGDLVWHPKRRGGYYQKGLFQHVVAVGNLPGDALETAETYANWWAALDRLRRDLQAHRLTMFTCTDAMPPFLRKPSRCLD